jgi:hypothetical protein
MKMVEAIALYKKALQIAAEDYYHAKAISPYPGFFFIAEKKEEWIEQTLSEWIEKAKEL